MVDILKEANALGMGILDDLLGVVEEGTRFEGKAVTPAVLASAKGLVLMEIWRAGLIAGGARGHGFAIARNEGYWSAPCFLNLTRWELGAVLGVEKSSTLMAAITHHGIDELAEGGHNLFGSNVTVQAWPLTSASGPNDVISLDALTSDWISASVGKGVLFDFSLTGGKLAVNGERNNKAYGAGVKAKDILHGKVGHKVEMEPLYHRINEIAAKARD